MQHIVDKHLQCVQAVQGDVSLIKFVNKKSVDDEQLRKTKEQWLGTLQAKPMAPPMEHEPMGLVKRMKLEDLDVSKVSGVIQLQPLLSPPP